MTTSYGATPPGITGTHYGGSSLGVLGSLVPSTGLDGAGYLYAGLSLPADNAKASSQLASRNTADQSAVSRFRCCKASGSLDTPALRMSGTVRRCGLCA